MNYKFRSQMLLQKDYCTLSINSMNILSRSVCLIKNNRIIANASHVLFILLNKFKKKILSDLLFGQSFALYLPSEQVLRNWKWTALTGKDANSSSYSWEMHSQEILKLLQASNNFCHLTITIQDICFNH